MRADFWSCARGADICQFCGCLSFGAGKTLFTRIFSLFARNVPECAVFFILCVLFSFFCEETDSFCVDVFCSVRNGPGLLHSHPKVCMHIKEKQVPPAFLLIYYHLKQEAPTMINRMNRTTISAKPPPYPAPPYPAPPYPQPPYP